MLWEAQRFAAIKSTQFPFFNRHTSFPFPEWMPELYSVIPQSGNRHFARNHRAIPPYCGTRFESRKLHRSHSRGGGGVGTGGDPCGRLPPNVFPIANISNIEPAPRNPIASHSRGGGGVGTGGDPCGRLSFGCAPHRQHIKRRKRRSPSSKCIPHRQHIKRRKRRSPFLWMCSPSSTYRTS